MVNANIYRWPLRVYIEDTDAGGIVYYVNYLKFLERARTEFMRSHGYDKKFIAEQGLMFVVHSLEAKFIKPATLDDELDISVEIFKIAKASIVFKQSIWCDNTLMFAASVKVACVDVVGLKPKAIPLELVKAL
jgi:4-hydroxybenzoyl-CoA thioesterase/acyl-CoA thioester hydrolase